jgi:hypothetical protein
MVKPFAEMKDRRAARRWDESIFRHSMNPAIKTAFYALVEEFSH